MRKRIICLGIILAISLHFMGCSPKGDAAIEGQLKANQDEIARLKQENAELQQFKDRFSFSLTKLEETLINLRNEGYLPLAGSQVNAPELLSALKEIRNIQIAIEGDEIILSIMPREWSPDFKTILVVYDVYEPVLNMSSVDAGKVSTMAGIFKYSEGKWTLEDFTREFKGDESFTIEGGIK